jgi:hypothetical protein
MATICRECRWHRVDPYNNDACAHGGRINGITGEESIVACGDKRKSYDPQDDCLDYEPEAVARELRTVACTCGYEYTGSFYDPAVYDVEVDETRKCPECGKAGYYLRRKENTDGTGQADNAD